jgi:hypothetical protein
MEFGLFMMPLHPPYRSYADSYDRDLDLLEMLTDQGFERVSVSTENYPLVFADVDEWWNWTWSHGYRQILERMSASQLERYRVTCFEHLQDRPVEGRLQVFLAVGMKPST